MMEGMDPRHLGMMGKKSMELHNYPDALRLFSMGLAQLESLNLPREFAALFLMDRAECFWQLGNVEGALEEMESALWHGLPRDDFFAEGESSKWSDHGYALLDRYEFAMAERCARFALYFHTSPTTRAQAFLCQVIARYEMGQITGETRETKEIKRLDPNFAKLHAKERKENAIKNMQSQNYPRAIKSFILALLLHPEDSSKMKFKRSVESHLANAYFKLKQYKEAVEFGEEIYRSNPEFRSTEEAERWKKRGNDLSKAPNLVDQAISCYSLALQFTPAVEKDLKGTIFSNRSLMYNKQGKADRALEDAQNCVENKPGWPKAHYRLGSCLLAQGKYRDAMEPFSESLKLLLSDASRLEDHAIDTLNKLLYVASKLPDGTSSIQYGIPKTYIQTVINKAVNDKDWATLHLLYLGGGGPTQFQKGSGGLAAGCDASSVPLTEVVSCDFPDLKNFVSILLDHKARDTPQEGRKTAFRLANDLKKFDVAIVLKEKNKTSGPDVQSEGKFKDDAKKAMEKGDNSEAFKFLKLSLKEEGNTTDEQRKTLQTLCELHFHEKAFEDCLRTGRKLKKAFHKEYKNKDKAIQWKSWGNELNKERKYDLMAEYYTLALEFTPASKIELMASLLSNRCLARNNLQKFEEALEDAKKCIEMRPKWFRGYSRQGTCLRNLNKTQEALKAFCKAHTHALDDKEKQITATDVIKTAMFIEGGESQITCTLSPSVLQFLVKDASEKKEWKKLRFLYLGSVPSQASRGLAIEKECDASCVPLDLLIKSDVEDVHSLVKSLLQHNASANGLRGCAKPPLLAAMEMMNFPLAVTLLRNNADPVCVVGYEIFINREGQPKQWLQLGRRAIVANDSEKAVMLLNMSLYLSDSNKDKTIRAQIYHALAEAYFMGTEYEKCIDAGKECFKLQPVKSEEEAKRWGGRADQTFHLGDYSRSIDYLNQALMYTPAESKETFSHLLCRRSEAFQQLDNYHSGLEDAVNASKICPEMSEVYLHQHKCFEALKREKEAMHAANEYLKRSTDENFIYGLLYDALATAANLKEGTSALTAPVSSKLLEKLVNEVIKKKDWRKLKILYLGGGGPARQPIGNGGLATGIDASTVPLGEIICSNVPDRLILVSVLLNHGASANAINESNAIPLDEALRLPNLPLVEKLVQTGANPCVMSKDGEPIIHQALRNGLQKNGTLEFLKAMVKSTLPEVQCVQDTKGNTLYHIACIGKNALSKKCDAIRILREANINPSLLNKKKESAFQKVPSIRDPRHQMLRTALERHKLNSSTSVPKENFPENVSDEQHDEDPQGTDKEKREVPHDTEENVITQVNNTPQNGSAWKIDEKQQLRMQRRENITILIGEIKPLSAFVPVDTNEEQDDIEMLDEPAESPRAVESSNGTVAKNETVDNDRGDDDDNEILGSNETEKEIDSKSPFEDLPWEVDCTDRVWKIMRSRRVDFSTRRRIIGKIRMLANGRWSRTLCKRLEGEARKKDIELYESKLTKGQRIIWERTIAFSGRCSEDPELRLKKRTPEGRIYSDIIRVWDIVLDHDKLQRSIDLIVKSHNRGMDCIVKRKLKGIPLESGGNSALTSECLPNKYAEIGNSEQKGNPPAKKSAPKRSTIDENFPQVFFPPASANEQEYHILKFYSFSTALVKTVLESDISSKIDFPFKITELEHAIVNLRPDPPMPIILLGRSGTGKTTCCLYRLWDQFQSYWERAETAGPHIPRYLPPTLETDQCSEDKETIQSRVEQDANQAVRSPLQGPVSPECQQPDDLPYSLSATSSQNDDQGTQLSYCPPKTESQLEDSDHEEKKQPEMYEHLHQIFITKNNVLCSEVEKNFKELCRACPAAQHRIPFEDQSLPAKIQSIAEEVWPLFVNSKDWLLMLDASLPGKAFFKRADDGSLLRRIDGWGEEDSHLQFIPATESDDESDHEEEHEEVARTQHASVETRHKGTETSVKGDKDPRREITYPVFLAELWPKMKKASKEKVDYHPTLVWTEIRSFIKGSAEALFSENGELSLEDYESLGKKKAPNFTADRKIVYDLYRVYDRQRSSKRMFDEADVVFNIHRRLQDVDATEWSVHQFYVDEAQDFTQAELSVLIRCCRYPNHLFFTGDTAQSIMRGISFRFRDLKSLFHHARRAAGITDDQNNFIRVPKKQYQLTHNYRSHAGILRLASSVVDLLQRYFPESFDRLEKDEGLFEGPRPVLLESCSSTDLAMILQGHQRQSSRIEFGAHQVVLVASNEARETLPDELTHGLVMTIYEAKGLEFDDVLIYNFFRDSQAGKEWRVVASFMRDEGLANVSNSTGLVEITEDGLTIESSRPLEFDPEKHKVLNSELKYLYTAITRARVNVWFFDEDKESRAPMFEFFQKRSLVNVVTMGGHEAGSGELASMFATRSTPDEWRKGGMRFYKHRLWRAAVQCFEFAGDDDWVQKSQAQQQAEEAIKLRTTNRQQMKDEFLRAGESFLKCGMCDEAEICLNNARAWTLLARLYEKTGKFQDAARHYQKGRLHKEASRCYEAQNNYAEAIEVFCRAGMFEEALRALERYNILASSGDLEGKQSIIPPRSTRTVERLLHQLADQHFKRGKKNEMDEVLRYLPSISDRITFLMKRGCLVEAARVLDDDGRRDEAARLLKDAGKFEEAERYSADPKFSADCLISLVRTTEKNEKSPAFLKKAIEKYKVCGDLNGQAEALLLLGRLSDDIQKFQEAGKLFDKCKNPCGEVESIMELLTTTSCAPPKTFHQWLAVRALERVLQIIHLLYMPAWKLTAAQRIMVSKCEEHFGLFKTDVAEKKRYFCKCGGRYARVDPKIYDESNTSGIDATIDTSEAHQKMSSSLITDCAKLVNLICTMLEETFSRNSLCAKIEMELTCNNPSCEYLHDDSEELFKSRFLALFHLIYLESVVESFMSGTASEKEQQDAQLLNFPEFKKFRSCERFYDFLFPTSGYRGYHLTPGNIPHLNRTKAVTKRISKFAYVLWKEKSQQSRRSDTDNFLKVSSFLQLIDATSPMVKWICEEEDEFENETRNPRFSSSNDLLSKNGMVKIRHGRYESYLQWWEEGKKRLYVEGDVENAAHLIIRRFLTLTAKRSKMTYPSIANTVMILEHQLTACLALYCRLCKEHRYPVCLPASYLTMVRFWDNLIVGAKTGKFTLYQAVERNCAREANQIRLSKASQSILDHMVRLTCGEEAHWFDVVGDALDSDESPSYCDSGEAERTLVLFLTMLCNCGKGISTQSEELMLRRALRIRSNPRLTSRIKTVLEEIQDMQGRSDVVSIFKKFLRGRAEELYDLRWNKEELCSDQACNPTTYPRTFDANLSHIRDQLKQEQHGGKTAKGKETLNLNEEEVTEESMDVVYTEEEIKEKENRRRIVSATAIQIEETEVKVEVLPAKALEGEQTNLEYDVSEVHFFQFKVDASACGICGVSFKSSTDETQMMDEDSKVSEPTGEMASLGSEIENLEAHRNSRAHLEKEKAFNLYKDLYLSKVHPLLAREAHLRKGLEDPSLSGIGWDMERLERSLSKVKSQVQNIESSWILEKVRLLQEAVKELEITLKETEEIVQQARQEFISAESEDIEPEEGEGLHEKDLEEENEHILIKEMPNKSGRGGRSKGQRKTRKK